MSKKSKKSESIDPNLTLAQVSEQYLQQMERDGKSLGTCFSYAMELKTAQAELGAETLVASLTPDDITRFNNSDRVMKLKSGRPKAQPSFLKTQRVLRLALGWAAGSGLIAASPVPTKQETASEPEPASAPEPEPKKKGRRRALVEIPAEQAPVETPAA